MRRRYAAGRALGGSPRSLTVWLAEMIALPDLIIDHHACIGVAILFFLYIFLYMSRYNYIIHKDILVIVVIAEQ